MISFIKRSLKILMIGSVVMVILLVFSVEYTSRPAFCNTCHIMEPYYRSWQTSSHSHVPCLKCHYPPGIKYKIQAKIAGLSQLVQYVTHTYGTKPWAEIDDAACLREGCHTTQLLEGPINFREGIFFNHKAHLQDLRRGKKLRCTSCHSQIVQGQHLTVTPTACFLCHFKNLHENEKMSECRECHNVEKIPTARFDHSFITKQNVPCRQCHGPMYTGTGDVPKQHCFSCHAEQARLDKYGDIDFVHNMHVTRNKVECTECHLEIQHKTQKVSISEDLPCQACHIDTHSKQKQLFLGFGGAGVEREPNMMLQSNVHCTGCHLYPIEKMGNIVHVARGDSCVSCHGKGFDKVLESWREALTKALSRSRDALDQAKPLVQGKRLSEEMVIKYKEAKDNDALIRSAHGVHNIIYSLDLLNTSIQYVNEILASTGSKKRFPEIKEAAQMKTSPCAACHTEPPAGIRTVFGKQFDHGAHAASSKTTCLSCHTDFSKHGKLTITAKDCSRCHGDIEMPHPETWKKDHPGVVNERASSCSTCHGSSSCSSCHGLAMPHPDDWMDVHYETVAEKGQGLCSKCHEASFCEGCHG